MLSIELREFGVEDALNDISECLELAAKSKSKKQKNEIIYRALGAVNTLRSVIDTIEIDGKADA